MMEELKQKLDLLMNRLSEKEGEFARFKQQIEVLKSEMQAISKQLEILENQQIEQSRIEKLEDEEQEVITVVEPVEETSIETNIPQSDEAENATEEIETPEPIRESEHEAIMRSIEEISRGNRRSTSSENSFEDRPTLGDKVSKFRINDIKRSIGINERFLFANELFNGDMSAFTLAVEELNHVESETAANRLLNENMAPKYRWDEENETVIAFKSLVSRRFA